MNMKIADVVVPAPYKIAGTSSLKQALEMMDLMGISHLPVVEGADLVGVVTRRDLELSNLICETKSYCPTVSGVCKGEPLIVAAACELGDVLAEMEALRVDYALASDDDGSLVGIFTSHDAMRVLSRLLRESRVTTIAP